ncbi:hypothetical protein M1116_02330 [Patescibacteria group bacterium]|nr:hypothetical protein [Patescibacteria group bacterium]
MNKTLLIVLSVVAGLLCLVLAFIYFTTPAAALPHFLPGFNAALTKVHHYKHGLGALILGLGCFVFAWFQSGQKSAK